MKTFNELLLEMRGDGMDGSLNYWADVLGAAHDIELGQFQSLDDFRAICNLACPNNEGYEKKCSFCACKKLLDEKHTNEFEIRRLRESVESMKSKGLSSDDILYYLIM